MEIKSGLNDVLESGTVISFQNQPLTFNFEDLEVRMVFQDDENDSTNHFVAKPIGSKILELTLFNFYNSLGTGTTEPIQLGVVRNRFLYLNFIIHTLGGKSKQKTVTYTWYLGLEVNHE